MSFIFRRIRTPNSVFNQDLSIFTAAAALSFAVILEEELGEEGGGQRSGKIWYQFGYVLPSSAPGEPEQEQSGSLRRSVGTQESEEDHGLIYEVGVGFFGEDQDKLDELEMHQDSPIYRGWLTNIVTDDYNVTGALEAGLNAVREYGA